MAVTLREVADKAGVSAMTVSRVINGAAGVRDDTKRRVEAVIAALDYVPNRIARGLMSSRTAILGLIVPDVVNPVFTLVVRGAETVARRGRHRGPPWHSGTRPAPGRANIHQPILPLLRRP